MKKSEITYFAGGSIGGKQGQSGGSIGGKTGQSGGSIPGKSQYNNNDDGGICIVLDSLKKGEIIYADTLRVWRDEYLINSNIGKYFVKLYYSISPKLVGLAKKLPIINKIVRKTAILVAKMVY